MCGPIGGLQQLFIEYNLDCFHMSTSFHSILHILISGHAMLLSGSLWPCSLRQANLSCKPPENGRRFSKNLHSSLRLPAFGAAGLWAGGLVGEKRALEEVQKMTDEEIRRMEELSRKKEAEVMQV